MYLDYSKKGIPFILFENGSRLSFSVTTENEDKGFKYLCFKCIDTKTVTVSGAKAKKKRTTEIVEDISFVMDMNFKRDKIKGIPTDAKKFFGPLTVGILKKIFNDLIEDGYFPRKNLKILEEKLNGEDPNDLLDDDPTATESFDNVSDKPKKKVSIGGIKAKSKNPFTKKRIKL